MTAASSGVALAWRRWDLTKDGTPSVGGASEQEAVTIPVTPPCYNTIRPENHTPGRKGHAMGTLFVGETGLQNPIYGVSRENIAPRLTRRNWKTKALWKRGGNGGVYFFIERGVAEDASGKEQPLYCVSVYGNAVHKFPKKYCPRFPRLQQALDFANGKGDSPFANAIEQADLELLPASGGTLGVGFLRR